MSEKPEAPSHSVQVVALSGHSTWHWFYTAKSARHFGKKAREGSAVVEVWVDGELFWRYGPAERAEALYQDRKAEMLSFNFS